ncbi:Extracellular superoxide dismutase [Cu-Zn], partial [Pseudolycoriella hygida]
NTIQSSATRSFKKINNFYTEFQLGMSSLIQKFLRLFVAFNCLSYGFTVQRNWWRCQISENKPVEAIAFINGTSIKGTVTFVQASCLLPVTIQVSLTGLTQGDHGFHVHEKGDISGGCTSMLAHYNPDSLNHGGQTDKIRHEGDLGNIQANANGVSSMTIIDSYITLSGPRTIIGRGIVVHNNRDDLGKGGSADSLTTGNSGARVACAVIGYA